MAQSDSPYLSDEEIRSKVINEIPLLKNRQSADQFEVVNALRKWTFQNVPTVFAEDKLTIKRVKNVSSTVEIPLNERLYLFGQGQAGARCGGTGATLGSIYRLFGFEAYEINMGDAKNNVQTHVVTLVKIQSEGKGILTVQDAFYNYTLVDRNNQPLDYFEILQILQSRQADKIIRLEGTNTIKLELISKDRDAKTEPERIYENGNRLVYTTNDWKTFENSALGFLKEQNLPANLLYLYLLPFGVHEEGTDNKDLILNKASQISGRRCIQDVGCLDI